MNNGLIERKKVISTLRKVFEKYNIGFENGQGGFADEVPKAIKAIPTAYDVDKVVERLEALRQNEIKIICKPKSHIEEMQACRAHNVLQDAIKIVKSGGIG